MSNARAHPAHPLDASPAPATVGVVLPTFPQDNAPDWSSLPSVIRHAEDAGVDALWACDHLFWHGSVFEAMTALAVAATVSERCAIGTAVLQLPLRSPASIAKEAASLQALSGGRLVLGVGSGAHEGEYDATGVEFSQRGRLLDHALDRLAALWAAGDSQYEQRPAPAEIPIWIGGSGDAARRRAAQRGQGWIPMFVPPHRLREANALLDAELADAGRDPADVTRATLLFVNAQRDGTAARREGLAWMSSLYRLPAEPLDRHLIAGEPKECVERLTEYVDARIQHLCLFVAADDPVPHIAAIVDDLRVATGASRPGTVRQ